MGATTHRALAISLAVLALAMAMVLGFGPHQEARAGGFGRPNINGARAVGMAGAYTALADDALSIYHNPAGLARIRTADLVLGAELVFSFGEYTPIGRTPEKASGSPFPLPFVGGGTRFLVGDNSFLALGVGIYNSFGGSVKFKKSEVTEGVIETQIGLFEFTPTIAYQVHKRVFIGLGLRMGLGFFNAYKSCGELTVCLHDPPMDPIYDTRVSTMMNVAFGYSLGIQVLPTDWMGIGVTYRSNLDVKLSKKGAVDSSGILLDAELTLPFPQSVNLGVFFKVHKRVVVAAQFDWVDNSRFQEIFLDVDGWVGGRAAIATDLHMRDSFGAHLGTEILVNKVLVLRGGMAYDSQAIPDEYRTRELSDTHMLTWNLGTTLRFGKWRVDAAAELRLGDVAHGFRPVHFPVGYAAPGTHSPGGTFSLHLGGGVAW